MELAVAVIVNVINLRVKNQW